MADINLMPVAGINTVSEDAALFTGGDSQRLYVRDAVNVDITPAGKILLRDASTLVTADPYTNLWQSPLHGDTFGVLDGKWVRINPDDWSSAELAEIGTGDVSHEVVNNIVCAAGPGGIFGFDGAQANRLTIDTPPNPIVSAGYGSLTAGTYGVAVSWLRGQTESATSVVTSVESGANGSLEVILPLCFDPSVTHARLYLTQPNGGELLRGEDYPIATNSIELTLLPQLGMAAAFRNLSPMPTGKFLRYWRGRLLTAKANILRFSEAMAYHLHDERHGFVQMPQRITFVQPVEGGIWVGQVDHVAFLQGSSPDTLSLVRKTARAPVPGSAIIVPADAIGGDLSQGGSPTVIWLADNGYVAGTSSGQVVELHSGVMRGIAANMGTSVVLDRRLYTAVI